MFIYNVTSKVSWEIQEEWLRWILSEHIAEVLETGLVVKYQLVRLEDVDDIDGPTFAVQYYLQTRLNYDQYIQQHAHLLQQKAAAKWGGHALSFGTLMEVIN